MIYGKLPFDTNEKQFLQQVKGHPDFHYKGIKTSEECKRVIKSMLEYDPEKRMKWSVLYEHPLFGESKFKQMYGVLKVDMKKNA